MCFYILGEESLAAFAIFPTPIMALFEIHQNSKVTSSLNCAFPLSDKVEVAKVANGINLF